MNRDFWGRRRDDESSPYDRDRRDFGQADYDETYAYDPRHHTGYRVDDVEEGRRRGDFAYRSDYYDAPRAYEERRSFGREAGDGRRERDRDRDRRIWAMVSQRLDDDPRIDASDVEVSVEDGVVFLNGFARSRAEKHRIEALAEVDGVADVVNAVRVRTHDRRGGFWRNLGF